MVKYLIDTNCLIDLARFYQPFDRDGVLRSYVQSCFESGDWILHEAVQREVKGAAGGIAWHAYSFLEAITTYPSIELIKPQQHKRIDRYWTTKRCREMKPREYRGRKRIYLRSADSQLVLTALSDKAQLTIVTDESKFQNDGKDFKKIPIICDFENIPCISLPDLLQLTPNAPTISVQTNARW